MQKDLDDDLVEIIRGVSGSAAWPGEKRLAFAVMQDALLFFQQYAFPKSNEQRMIHAEITEWIRNEEDDWPWSFEALCALLQYDPSWLRAKLFAWYDEQVSVVRREKRTGRDYRREQIQKLQFVRG